MLQGMGMLEVPWLAVELREWFAVTRSTFLILSVSMPCGIILVGDLMNLYEYEDHSLQKLAQRLHHLSDTEVGSGFISLSSRERFPLPFSISIIRCCNIWWRYNPGHGLSFIEAPKRSYNEASNCKRLVWITLYLLEEKHWNENMSKGYNFRIIVHKLLRKKKYL